MKSATLSINDYKQLRKDKRRKQQMEYYQRKKRCALFKSKSKNAIKQENYRKRQQLVRDLETVRKQKHRERQQRYMERKRNARVTENKEPVYEGTPFKSRTSKFRAMQKFKKGLPQTPNKRTQLLATYLNTNKSPTVKALQTMNIIINPEERKENELKSAIVNDIKSVVKDSKMKRSKDSLAAMNVLVASVSGENISEVKCRTKLAKSLELPVKRISRGQKIRTRIFHSEKSCWLSTCRKTKSNALSDQVKKLAYDFWLEKGISRPTGNKKDIKRERLGPKVYASHMVHILEKTQTEVYLDFKTKHPNVKISQRSFEACKPFFVRPVRLQDRNTCCCRYHTEFKSVFTQCMAERKKIKQARAENGIESEGFPIFNSQSEVVAETLCPTGEDEEYYNIKCLNRECTECGVGKLQFMPEELDTSENASNVTWEKFEYVSIKVKGNKERKKLMLVKKNTKAGEMFAYLRSLLSSFPAHQFRAQWQNQQLRSLISNLPLNDCICIHDFSENFRCSDKEDLQSSYFQRTEVTLHVSIIHRHAQLEIDGKESTETSPEIITEHFCVISDDETHDHHFVHHVQTLVCEYLKSIDYQVDCMHEFTDGCQCQYKSRHCMGDISYGCHDFGYKTMIRNYFETSHAKGAQDAAGGFVKRQTDLAVLRGNATIQCARDLFDYAEGHIQNTHQQSSCARRIFRFIDCVDRNRNRQFTSIAHNRDIHQIKSTKNGVLSVTNLSCYTCENCLEGAYDKCENTNKTGAKVEIRMKKELRESGDDVGDDEAVCSLSDTIRKGSLLAVFTDDENEDYFLMKATDKTEILTRAETDDWENVFRKGSKIVRGLYYKRAKNGLSYKLLPKKQVLVSTHSIMYVFTELRATNKLQLPNDLHETVLDIVRDSYQLL